ncbi:MAG: FMN-binding protein [Candidatus Margulisbacteria bacterium]|nr:FMN-binding protein [Candidatus Margulisiibacteriota bacterium]
MYKRVIFLSFLWMMAACYVHGETKKAYERIFYTPKSALSAVFPYASRIEPKSAIFTHHQQDQIEAELGMKIDFQDINIHTAYNNQGQENGRAYILNELGKHYPITLIVKILPEGVVGDVKVMAYRERVGGQIRKKRFLNQFMGKSADATLRVNQDIDGITGATISSWSVSKAVKKALVIHKWLSM